jgi:hypothetical protein
VAEQQKQGGTRGHELDSQLTFTSAMSRAVASELLKPWGIAPELYGLNDEIRGARLTGDLDLPVLRELLRAGFEGGLLRGAEVGRRGYLRSVTGSTEWMPWRRNVVLSRSAWADVALEDGVRYLLE